MRIANACFILILISIVVTSCINSNTISEEQLRKIVAINNASLEKCFLEGNAEKLKEIYADDARLCPNNDEFYVGRDAIYKFWKADMASSRLNKMETNTLSVNGTVDLIYETGITKTESTSDGVLYKSAVKFINVWKRQPDNSYKLAIDFWNKYTPSEDSVGKK